MSNLPISSAHTDSFCHFVPPNKSDYSVKKKMKEEVSVNFFIHSEITSEKKMEPIFSLKIIEKLRIYYVKIACPFNKWIHKIKKTLGFKIIEQQPLKPPKEKQTLASLLKLKKSIEREDPYFFAEKYLLELPIDEQNEFFRLIWIANGGVGIRPDDPLDVDHNFGANFFEAHSNHPAVNAAIQARIKYWTSFEITSPQ